MQARYRKPPKIQPLRSQSLGKEFLCLCCSTPEDDLTNIRAKAKCSHATLSDVFMAAYARMTAYRQGIGQVTISCPADLRGFHPKSDVLTIANLTGIYREISVNVVPDDPFCRTLSQVSIEMNLQKSRFRCFSGIPLLCWAYPEFPRWFIAQAIRKTYRIASITYTNIGAIDHEKLLFNGCQMIDCFVTGAYRLPLTFSFLSAPSETAAN